jgi:class 3 adenylate cyclase
VTPPPQPAGYAADRIPGASFVELDGIDHGWWVNSTQIVADIEPFLTGLWKRDEWDLVKTNRVLATVMFTDIADSTAKLAEVGDATWRELVEAHHALSDEVRELGLHVRAGLHTGECEVVAGKIGGIAVHIGARAAAEARADEVVVSSTVKDLVAGSGLTFADRGHVRLKGVPGEWHLYAVDPALGDYRGGWQNADQLQLSNMSRSLARRARSWTHGTAEAVDCSGAGRGQPM